MDSDGPSTVVLTVAAADWRTAINDLETVCDRVVRAALERGTTLDWLQAGEVSVLLADDALTRRLNARYRRRDRPTNVLSFPIIDLDQGETVQEPPPGPTLLGDVALSIDRVRAEAAALDKSPIDHFSHLLTHGVLHLLGYDHQDDDQAVVMERLEDVILRDLGMAPPRGDGVAAETMRTWR